jgi:hypothetical protein
MIITDTERLKAIEQFKDDLYTAIGKTPVDLRESDLCEAFIDTLHKYGLQWITK